MFKRKLQKIETAHGALDRAIAEMHKKVLPYVDEELADFFIFYQHGDGYVIAVDLEDDTAPHNAPLDQCLEVIEEKGRLTVGDYLALSI